MADRRHRVPDRSVKPKSSGPKPTEKISAFTPNQRPTRRCPNSCTNVTTLTTRANGARNSGADRRCRKANTFKSIAFASRSEKPRPKSILPQDGLARLLTESTSTNTRGADRPRCAFGAARQVTLAPLKRTGVSEPGAQLQTELAS